MKRNKKNVSESIESKSKTVELKPFQEKLEKDDLEQITLRGCVVSGNIGCGKTILAKHIYLGLLRQISIAKDVDLNLRVFDVVGNWQRLALNKTEIERLNNFCSYSGIPPENPLKSEVIDKHTYRVEMHRVNIFTLKFSSKEERLEIMERIASEEFNEQRDCMLNNQKEPEKRFIYVIEEANTLFTTQSINKGFWLDFIAYSRNYKITGVYIMQRLSDSSTKVIERIPNFIFGQTRGQNDKRKIKAMLPDKEARRIFENLEEHEFLCYIGNKLFKLKLTEKEAEKLEEVSFKQ